MTAPTAPSQLSGTGYPLLPRVNLLPPEIAEQRRFRQVQYGLGGAVLAAVVVVLVLYLAAAHSVSQANDRLAAATARQQQLNAESARYSAVTAVKAQADAAKAMLVQAMGQEVRYSLLLNDLALSVPDNVWLTSLNFTQTAPTPAVPATPGAPAALGTIGTMTVGAVGFSHDDVAVWLDSLATQPDYANPDFTSSTEALLGTRKTVTFNSTAALTTAALSNRYTKPIGG